MKLHLKIDDMSKRLQTPSQTVGPFFAYGLTPRQYGYDYDSWVDGDMAHDLNESDIITLSGRIFDGDGTVIPDAMVELWLNDGINKRFGRFGTGTDPENRFIFRLPKPQSVDGQAPFVSVVLFMRGQLIHSFTRIYFSDESMLNEGDEVLSTVPLDRRRTLMAHKKGDVYEFNIYMQGPNETVFFEV